MNPPLTRARLGPWLVALWIAPLSARALTIDAPWTTSDATASLALSQAEIGATGFTDVFAGAAVSDLDLHGLGIDRIDFHLDAIALGSQDSSPDPDGR